MISYDYLSSLWDEIFFALRLHGQRDDIIKATNNIIFFFFSAERDKKLFHLTIGKFLKRAKIKKDLRDEILILYRDFYKTKKMYERAGAKFATVRQKKLLKLESKLFLERTAISESKEFLDEYEKEANYG